MRKQRGKNEVEREINFKCLAIDWKSRMKIRKKVKFFFLSCYYWHRYANMSRSKVWFNFRGILHDSHWLDTHTLMRHNCIDRSIIVIWCDTLLLILKRYFACECTLAWRRGRQFSTSIMLTTVCSGVIDVLVIRCERANAVIHIDAGMRYYKTFGWNTETNLRFICTFCTHNDRWTFRELKFKRRDTSWSVEGCRASHWYLSGALIRFILARG